MKLRPLKKKGAIELGVGTMVIIVIAVVLLVLALIFVRRIFTGATHNVDQLNDAVRSQINNLFGQEGQKVALYLPGGTASIRQGETFGIAFGILDDKDGGTYKYTISAIEGDGCSTTAPSTFDDWVILGGSTGSAGIPIGAGKAVYRIAKIRVPNDEHIGCQVAYDLVVKRGSDPYERKQIFVEVKSKGFGGFF